MVTSRTKNSVGRLVALVEKSRWMVLIPLGMIVVFGTATEVFVHERHMLQQSEGRQAIMQTAGAVRAVLETELNATVHLATGIESYIVARRGDLRSPEVESILSHLYGRGRHFRNIGLAPDNRITHISPIRGNEKAIGLYYPDLPDQWPVLEQIIRDKKPRLAGPIKLVQGGEGLVYRVPVYLDGQYWGLISTVINANSLFSVMEHIVVNHAKNIALRGRNGTGAAGEFFYGNPDLFRTNSPTMDISIPGGVWQLAIKIPDEQVHAPLGRIGGWTVTLLLASLTFFLLSALRRQGQLMAAAAEQNRLLNEANQTAAHEQLMAENARKVAEDTNIELVAANATLETRRREAEETHETLQQLSRAVENSPVTIVITDHLGRIEYVNTKFSELTGYQPEEAFGKNPRILNAGVQPKELYRELWSTILAGQEWRGDLCNRKKNGDIYWEHASISPIKDERGATTHFVAVKEDITDQRRIAVELLTAQDAAHASNRSKSDFLANMSHEIRTPLNAIIGFSALALKSSLPPRQHDYIGKIHTAGEMLLNIINDILDFSKIEARQLKVEQIPFRLDIVIANTSGMLQQKALDAGLKLIVEPVPNIAAYLVGDPHRLSQILVNLLNNAVKFTEQGEVALETVLLLREGERVKLKFSVRDTGIGVPPEHVRELFKPFTQGNGSTSRRFGGTGLGLSISKELVALMEGDLWCENTSSEGSTFCFTAWFGISHTQAPEQPKAVAEPASVRRLPSKYLSDFRLLLVEDNEIHRLLVIEILRETGAMVDCASDGAEAVAMITTGSINYDLVLMDIQMSVMGGYEATRLIRADSRFAALPVIALTAHAMNDVHQEVMQAGLDAHIPKPIDAQSLHRLLRYFLCEKGARTARPGLFDEGTGDEAAVGCELSESPAPGVGSPQIREHEFFCSPIAGLNVAAALSRINENEALLLRVLHAFVEEQGSAARDIGEALSAGDAELAGRHAHTLKSTAGVIGAEELEASAQKLEKAIVLGESPEIVTGILEQCATELDLVITELAVHLPSSQSSGETLQAGALDISVVAPILVTLFEYITGRDCRAERYLNNSHESLAGLPAQDIGKIQLALQNFDFAVAGDALLDLASRNGITLTHTSGGT